MAKEKVKKTTYRNIGTHNLHSNIGSRKTFEPGQEIPNPEECWVDWPSQRDFFLQIGVIEEVG